MAKIASASGQAQRRRPNDPRLASAMTAARPTKPKPTPGPISSSCRCSLGFRRQIQSSGPPGVSRDAPASAHIAVANAKKEPSITQVFKGAGVFPNGLYPQRDGMLLMVGFVAPDKPQAIYALGVSGQIKKLSDPIGRLDGVYEMQDGSLLYTDWNVGALVHRNANGETRKLSDGFKGPADFCVLPNAGGLTVYLPDLVQSQLRIIQLRK